MRTAANARAALLGAALALLVAAALAACWAPPAHANRTLPAPTQVSDDATRVHVSKLDADTHGYVEGASMAIIDKETGTVVDEWVTGSAAHASEKNLDVGREYVLREVGAPDGYERAGDTVFVVNETEGAGITVLSGPGELTESYKVNLYDKAKAVENEKVVTKTNETTTRGNDRTVAPKTGDETPVNLVALLVVLGVLGIGALEFAKRRIAVRE